MAATVALQHEGLEHLAYILSKLLGHVCCREVALVHGVWDEPVADACLVEQTRCVGFRQMCHRQFVIGSCGAIAVDDAKL